MRYSLIELKKLVPEILSSGNINTRFDGYPIIHSVFIELRDEDDNTKHIHYIKLIEIILQYPGCEPDVLDKHRKPLLAYAAEMGKLNVLIMLLRAGANPNLTSTQLQYTALEWAIQRNATSKAIPILKKRTDVTQQMLKNCQEMFETALEDEDVDTINTLLDLNLVKYNLKFRRNLSTAHELPTGFWIRMITNPKEELKILREREKLDDSILFKQRHTTRPHPNLHYTNYSPATYVRHSIPISIFSFQDAGVMILPTNNPISYWFDGHEEELTRDFSYHEDAHLNNGQKTGQYWEITPQDIKRKIEELYKKEVQRYRRIAEEDDDEDQNKFDRHGVILDKLLCERVRFSWNEGLIRYKSKQIFGILVDPENETSSKKAFELKNTLQLDVPFYSYSEYPGTTHVVNQSDLIQRWNLGIPAVAKKSAVKPLVMSNGHQLPKTTHESAVHHPTRVRMTKKR